MSGLKRIMENNLVRRLRLGWGRGCNFKYDGCKSSHWPFGQRIEGGEGGAIWVLGQKHSRQRKPQVQRP